MILARRRLARSIVRIEVVLVPVRRARDVRGVADERDPFRVATCVAGGNRRGVRHLNFETEGAAAQAELVQRFWSLLNVLIGTSLTERLISAALSNAQENEP